MVISVTNFLQAECHSCHPTNSIKTLKGLQSTNPNQRSGLILFIHYQTPKGCSIVPYILALQHQYQYFEQKLLLLLPFYGPLSGTNRVRRHQKKYSPTHLSRSSSNLYQLLPSTMIHSTLPVQFMCLTIFLHNLSPSPLWSTSWSGALHLILHIFLHPINVVFLQQMPIPSQPVLL